MGIYTSHFGHPPNTLRYVTLRKPNSSFPFYFGACGVIKHDLFHKVYCVLQAGTQCCVSIIVACNLLCPKVTPNVQFWSF